MQSDRTWSSRRLFLLLAVLYSLGLVSFAGISLWLDYRETLRATEDFTENVTRLLEEHIKRTIEATDLAVQRVADRVGLRGLAAVTAAEAEWQAIHDMAQASPQTSAVYVSDATGRLRLSSSVFPAPQGSLAGRDYFTALRDGAPVFIGKVALDPYTGTYSFTVARRLSDAQGGFGGVVAALIEQDYLRTFYRSLQLGSTPGLGVYKLDGAILVRAPLKPEDIDRNMAQNPVYTKYLPQAPVGTYRGASAYDGVVRIVSYRKVEEPPLLVWVAMSQDDALGDWRQRVWRNGILAAVSLVLMLILSWLVLRAMHREEHMLAEMKVMNHSLERSNGDLEQFVYIASHDLQEPLRMIASYLQLLERRYRGKLDDDAHQFIDFAVNGARRMQTLINDLLVFSHVGRTQVFHPIDLSEITAEVAANLALAIKETDVDLRIHDLPTVAGDRAQLSSLLQNLIGNAIKYRAAERSPQVIIGAVDRGDHWAVYVRDNGIGIEPEYFSHIFLVFRRLHNQQQYPGTGIGLAVCKRIVERHGGRIWVDSTVGEGTTFWFTLPKGEPPMY